MKIRNILILCFIMLTAMTCEDEEYIEVVEFKLTNKTSDNIAFGVSIYDERSYAQYINCIETVDANRTKVFMAPQKGYDEIYYIINIYIWGSGFKFKNTPILTDTNFEEVPYLYKITMSYDEWEAHNFELVYSEDGFEK